MSTRSRFPVRSAVVCFCGLAIVLALTTVGAGGGSSRALSRRALRGPAKEAALHAYGRLPLAFVSNNGQVDHRVRYSAQAGGASFFFTRSEAVVALAKGKRGLALQLRFLGVERRPVLSGAGAGPGRVTYLLGNKAARWRRNLATYQELVYRRLWPGIAMHVRGQDGRLEYEFRVRPGANPSLIRLAYRGERRLTLGPGGDLRIETALGSLRDLRPVSYQQIGGRRIAVKSRFVLGRNGSYGFALGAYDRNHPLVIDPGLVYSTYLAGTGLNNLGLGIAVDSAGSAYVSGWTDSSNFPTTAGAFETSPLAQREDFVTKLNTTGTALDYSTYLSGSGGVGGSLSAYARIAIDSAGNAYITSDSGSGFPTTAGAFQTSCADDCPFVAKLNPSGTALVYSTYLGDGTGGPCAVECFGIAVDSSGNAYVTGPTSSTDFPTTAGAFQTTLNGSEDAFVAKLNTSGTALDYSTYLGGSGPHDWPQGIAIDNSGNAYIVGSTGSSDFPTTTGAFQTTFGGGDTDVFVTKLNAAGTALDYSTYLGGSGDEGGGISSTEGSQVAVAVDSTGSAYVAGWTSSTNFPTTSGAFRTTIASFDDAFVTKLNTAGTGLVYSTYLGGNQDDFGEAIAVDSAGNAYVSGMTDSSDFPTTAGALHTSGAGGFDVFVTKLNGTGAALDYSTYLGGGNYDEGTAIAIDSAGNAYLTGDTASNNFPTSAGAFDTAYSGSFEDAFVSKVDLTAARYLLSVAKAGTGSGTVTSSPTGISCGSACSHAYTSGTQVTLSASAASGSGFTSWSGACSGTSTCKVTMTAAKSVTATFDKVTVPPKLCVVPNVKGKSLSAAKRAIKAHNCGVGKIKHAFSRKVKKGHVISQKPKAHKRLKHGAKVNLVVSKGR